MKIVELYDDIPEYLLEKKSVAIDTETTGLNIFRDRLCLIQLNFCDDNVYLLKSNDFKCAKKLSNMLQNSDIQKIFHYARFDVDMLKKYIMCPINNVYCTKIASKIARTYSSKHSLKDIVKEFLNIEMSKEEQSSYWGGEKLTDSQKKYAAFDVLFLHELRNRLNEILLRESKMELANRCFSMIDIITDLDLKMYDFDYIFNH